MDAIVAIVLYLFRMASDRFHRTTFETRRFWGRWMEPTLPENSIYFQCDTNVAFDRSKPGGCCRPREARSLWGHLMEMNRLRNSGPGAYFAHHARESLK